jgi:DNA repair protein RadC
VRDANAPDPQLLTRPKAVAKLVREGKLIPDDARQHFGVFFLNTDLRVLGYHELAVGTLDAILLSPREVYGAALRVLGTASIILVHNHPSGNPRPSRADIALTKRIAAAGRLLDVPVKDHVIVGNGTGAWTSLANKGVLR